MNDKPHLLLDWHLNCNTGKLTCTLLDGNLVYEAHSGGIEGYTKVYNNETSRIATDIDWLKEKHWISENFGQHYGYYQPGENLSGSEGLITSEGLGEEGEYLDHLQRSQYLLLGLDTATITHVDPKINPEKKPAPVFRTPDKGLTIYKLLPTSKTFYYSHHTKEIPDMDNPEAPADSAWYGTCPCQMLPYIRSYMVSNYEEMAIVGITEDAIEQCKRGEWDAPARPELQRHFTYPTEHTYIVTANNLHTLDN